MPEQNQYFLGTHDAELERLKFQSDTWKPQTKELWSLMGISKGAKVLDLGCGPGYCTFDLAKLVGPSGEVVAVDKSQRFLDLLQNKIDADGVTNVRPLQGDIAHNRLPEEGFDFIFARWLHQYVDNLEQVVSYELEALSTNGKMGALEVYNYRGVSLSPQSALFNKVTDKIVEFYKDSGRNVNAGGDLPKLFQKQGASIEHLIHSSPLAFSNQNHWEWYRQFSFSMLPRLVEAQRITDQESADYQKEMETYQEIPGTFLSVPAHIGLVVSKV